MSCRVQWEWLRHAELWPWASPGPLNLGVLICQRNNDNNDTVAEAVGGVETSGSPHTPSGSQACLCPHNLCPGVGQLGTIQQDQPGCLAKAGWPGCPRLEIAYFSRGSPIR